MYRTWYARQGLIYELQIPFIRGGCSETSTTGSGVVQRIIQSDLERLLVDKSRAACIDDNKETRMGLLVAA